MILNYCPECRKPKPGMLIKAAEDFNIDLTKSFMIGDSERDILAGKAAGCRESILVGERGETDSLLGAVKRIM